MREASNEQCEVLLEEIVWGPYLATVHLTAYFYVSTFLPASGWQDAAGGDVSLSSFTVDRARLETEDGEHEASEDERALLKMYIRGDSDCLGRIIAECEASV